MDIILKASIPKLREKLLEALQAVLPIVAIVLVLCFSAPSPAGPFLAGQKGRSLCKSNAPRYHPVSALHKEGRLSNAVTGRAVLP